MYIFIHLKFIISPDPKLFIVHSTVLTKTNRFVAPKLNKSSFVLANIEEKVAKWFFTSRHNANNNVHSADFWTVKLGFHVKCARKSLILCYWSPMKTILLFFGNATLFCCETSELFINFPSKQSGYVTFFVKTVRSETLIPHTWERKKPKKLLRPWRNVKWFSFYLADHHQRRLHIDYLAKFKTRKKKKGQTGKFWKELH